LRAAAIAAGAAGTIAIAAATATAHDFHRLAFDPKVGRRDAAAAIDQRELERLAVGQVGQAGLLDRGNVNEHILAAVVTNDEAEALLRVEEFYDALAFANDLGRHSATRAAAETAAAAGTAAEAATAAAAAISATAAAAAEAAAGAIATAAAAAAVAKATAESATITGTAVESSKLFATTETIALVTAASAAVTLTPSIETHKNSNSLVPQ